MTLAEVLESGTATLRAGGSPSARLDAEVLLAHLLGLRRVELYAHPERTLTPAEESRYLALLERRRGGEPVSYLVGWKEFYGLPLAVDRRVMIPRPETEVLVERALACARIVNLPEMTIADIGTGSGCIVVALARGRRARVAQLTAALRRALRAVGVSAGQPGDAVVAGRAWPAPTYVRFFSADELVEELWEAGAEVERLTPAVWHGVELWRAEVRSSSGTT